MPVGHVASGPCQLWLVDGRWGVRGLCPLHTMSLSRSGFPTVFNVDTEAGNACKGLWVLRAETATYILQPTHSALPSVCPESATASCPACPIMAHLDHQPAQSSALALSASVLPTAATRGRG